MPTGVQLQQLRVDLRAEIGQSLNAAHGVNQVETQNYYLRRTQEEIFASQDWPKRLIYADVDLEADTRYYAYPEGTTFETVNKMWCSSGTQWLRMEYGISPEDLNGYNSDVGDVSWPVRRWQYWRDPKDQSDAFEVWPVPNQAARLRIEAHEDLLPLREDSDVCTLDSNLIVLFAAAEMLARKRAEDASVKLTKAQEYKRNLLSQMEGDKRQPFVLGGGQRYQDNRRPRAGLDYIPEGGM